MDKQQKEKIKEKVLEELADNKMTIGLTTGIGEIDTSRIIDLTIQQTSKQYEQKIKELEKDIERFGKTKIWTTDIPLGNYLLVGNIVGFEKLKIKR